MDPIVVGILGIIFLLVVIGLGIHIGIALGLTGFLGIMMITGFAPAARLAMESMYFTNASYALVTLPLFILMGYLGAGGGISKTLYDGLSKWTGKIKGSLGVATILGCAGFGAVCGSSIVTAAVFAKVSAPEMVRHGYDRKIAYGICAAGGSIGMLIPPSILAVLYGILTGLSVGKLLLAGIGPGILLTALFSLQIIIYSYRNHPDAGAAEKRITWKERFATIPSFWPVIVTALIIFGGIFGGVFSPTEAAAFGTLVIFFLLITTKGGKAWGMLKSSLRDTASTSAMVFLTMAGACVFSRYLAITGISEKVVEIILALKLGNFMLMVLLSVVFLALGCLMDSISMMTVMIPILHPVVMKLGIDPYYFALIFIVATQVGIITPPFGLAVFTVKGVAEAGVTLEEIFMGSMAFFYIMCVSLLLMILFPVITLFLIR
ncbi:MAG: Sialic acid TRAP transporter permease protein SiaT [Syntrophaceae bacterium PtaU1.Bin231]|nr:MAG: Sialic acid TRAP transporter permease protein SiaT [Syntrophaceae bacterium PtaU1.Bin231]